MYECLESSQQNKKIERPLFDLSMYRFLAFLGCGYWAHLQKIVMLQSKTINIANTPDRVMLLFQVRIIVSWSDVWSLLQPRKKCTPANPKSSHSLRGVYGFFHLSPSNDAQINLTSNISKSYNIHTLIETYHNLDIIIHHNINNINKKTANLKKEVNRRPLIRSTPLRERKT